MKKNAIILGVVMALGIFSCKENAKEMEVHQADEQIMHAAQNLNVKVDNAFDPICEMETEGHVSDTIHLGENVYGFCSAGCKEEFAKNPEKYLSKLN